MDGYIRIFDIRKGQVTKDYYKDPIVCLDLGQNNSTLLASFLNSGIRLIDSVTSMFAKIKIMREMFSDKEQMGL